MADHDYYGMISTCKRYAVNGVGAQQYWLDILDYLVNKECVEGKDVGNEVKEVLDCIHDDSKLPPMLVLQTLSKNRHLTMDAVQSYISKGMELQSQRIKATCQESLRLEEETKQMEKEVTSLRSKPILFQNNKCSACMNPLDLPSVHFFCMHSYHQRCLEEAESECPLCAPMAHNIWEIQAALSRQAMDPKSSERFFQRLEGSSDGFSVVAEQFSRGFFCPASTEELG